MRRIDIGCDTDGAKLCLVIGWNFVFILLRYFNRFCWSLSYMSFY